MIFSYTRQKNIDINTCIKSEERRQLILPKENICKISFFFKKKASTLGHIYLLKDHITAPVIDNVEGAYRRGYVKPLSLLHDELGRSSLYPPYFIHATLILELHHILRNIIEGSPVVEGDGEHRNEGRIVNCYDSPKLANKVKLSILAALCVFLIIDVAVVTWIRRKNAVLEIRTDAAKSQRSSSSIAEIITTI